MRQLSLKVPLHFSVYFALKSIAVLPMGAFALGVILRYSPERQAP
jgi:hypothetical protein